MQLHQRLRHVARGDDAVMALGIDTDLGELRLDAGIAARRVGDA
jgi:hypothetical protein